MSFLVKEMNEHVLTVTMSSPDTRNALTSDEQFGEFEKLCVEINDDKAIRAVVLTGEGSAFCAGGNVKDMRDRKGLSEGNPYKIRNNYKRDIQKIPAILYDLEVPTIAAVNGPAIGAGCDLACMCDIRIGSEKAKFAESFVKLGIIPGDGGAWLLPRLVGQSKAAELTFTGDLINADEALSCGLISKLVSSESLMDEAQSLAERIASNPGHSLRMAKRLLREGQHVSLQTLLEMSAAFQAISHHTEEHDQAIEKLLSRLEKSNQ